MISYDDIKSGKAAMPVAAAPVAKEIGKLPALVEAAAAQLAQAKSAAEVLDAKDKASLIYDAAKRAARLAAAKGAHDTLIAEAHRAQANALKIEAGAKERLADEYDAAQPKDAAVAGRPKKSVPEQDAFTAEGAGLSRKIVHDARRVRNAERIQPGVVAEAVEQALAAGEEPTRAAVNAAVAKVFGKTQPVDARNEVERDADAIQSAWDHASDEARAMFLAANNLTESVAASPGGPSLLAARKADESAAVHSPSTVPAVEAVAEPQAPRPIATATVSNPRPPPRAADMAGELQDRNEPVSSSPASGAINLKTLSKADQIRLLRPHCQHPGSDLCGGSGRNHCHGCKKLMAEGEAI